ncbi:hypothetical protein EYF80_031810 [Liparis tanakae]|uniref:Uncharacterized protein n=1 Tax=Liparis tanakae TaxID=230148 RepID=A0A4Z2GWT6_9TELE|nr:hypothetical protein EYF80_031810 [Liparis tanakae]
MLWSMSSFLNTILTEFPGNLRSRKRIQKKLKFPWNVNATTATFRVCRQSSSSVVRDNRWWTKSPLANRQPYSVTLVAHGNRRTFPRLGPVVELWLTPGEQAVGAGVF